MAIIIGNDASNPLYGTNLADQIFGRGGNDALEGLAGDDLLEGGAGIDDQYGGNGFDYASYRSSGAGVRVYLDLGYGLDGDAEGDGLYDIEGVIGSDYRDILFGKDDRNVLRGGDGNDTLVGFGDDDELEGGAGADELVGDNGLDYASYRASDGAVNVRLDQFVFMGGHAQGDQLFSIEGVIGSAFSDTILGDAGRNVFRGEAGNDGLAGRAGDDRLEGGGGNDYLVGDAGNDELRGGAGIDTANFSFDLGPVVADLASGTASGAFSGTDRLFGIENLVDTQFNDQLLGNSGANLLVGGYGADVLTGRGGADRFYYSQTQESAPTARDIISDFSRAQGDKIDLAGIDAKVHATGNEAFTFVGQGQFTGEGQLRFFQQNGDTFIEANTDNSVPGADMVIVLDSLVTPKGLDFFL